MHTEAVSFSRPSIAISLSPLAFDPDDDDPPLPHAAQTSSTHAKYFIRSPPRLDEAPTISAWCDRRASLAMLSGRTARKCCTVPHSAAGILFRPPRRAQDPVPTRRHCSEAHVS